MGLGHFKSASLFFICILFFGSNCGAQDLHDEKQIEVSLRMIGHQILLNSKDSTSRVLPILKEKDRYRIQFESDFVLNPEELVSTIDRVVRETGISKSYIVEVEECETLEVVYSFQVDDIVKSDIIPCKGRVLPKSCYNLLITIIKPKGTNTETSELIYVGIALLAILIALSLFFFASVGNHLFQIQI